MWSYDEAAVVASAEEVEEHERRGGVEQEEWRARRGRGGGSEFVTRITSEPLSYSSYCRCMQEQKIRNDSSNTGTVRRAGRSSAQTARLDTTTMRIASLAARRSTEGSHRGEETADKLRFRTIS